MVLRSGCYNVFWEFDWVAMHFLRYSERF